MPRKKHRVLLAQGWNSKRFTKALRKLQRDFPECYVEAWTPTDFADPGEDRPWSVTVEESHDVVYKLEKHFDANNGTNWERVRCEVDSVAKHLNLQAG